MKPKRDIIGIRRISKKNDLQQDIPSSNHLNNELINEDFLKQNEDELIKLISTLTKLDISIRNQKFEILRIKEEAKKLAQSLKIGVNLFNLFYYYFSQ